MYDVRFAGSNAVSLRPSRPSAKMISGTLHEPKSPIWDEDSVLLALAALAVTDADAAALCEGTSERR